MAARIRRGSGICGMLQHFFACQKQRLRLVIRTVGLTRARSKLGLANLACNLLRFV